MTSHDPLAVSHEAPGVAPAPEPARATAGDVSKRDRATLEIARQLATTIPPTYDPDLTMRQLFVRHLLSQAPRSIGVIAKDLGITISSASGLIDRLETTGLIERVHPDAPEDRRRVICHLTAVGTTAFTDHLRLGNLRLEVLLAELSHDEARLVEQAMEFVIRAAREVVAKAKPAPPGAPSAA